MKATKLILPVMAISFVGLGVFFFTRKAAAADKAKQAFAVDPNCGSFLSLDDELAKSAAMAAALAVHPSPDSSAIEAIKAILAFMFPQCSWVDPIPEGRTFIEQNGRSMTWGTIVTLVGDKTVAQLKDMAMQGGQQGATLPGWPIRYFGTGCAACDAAGIMGTGASRSRRNR